MKKIWIIMATLAVILLGRVTLSQTTLTSMKLTDTVRQGVGAINLLNSRDGMTSSLLEAYRADNGGLLSFAVDVNENAAGSENSDTMGVSVTSASITVTFADGTSKTYNQFFTQTQSLVAAVGTPGRQTRYSVLGDAGSSSITPRRIGGTDFDSTLRFAVPDNLSTVTRAVLNVQLVNTDTAQGDPETYYDYTGGFEDVAILTQATAKYLDEVLPYLPETLFRSLAPGMELSPEGQATHERVLAASSATTSPSTTDVSSAAQALSWIQRPGADSFHIVAYEDMYPSKGDYDFNDAVVAYQYQLGVNASGLVERVQGVAYLVARGSNYTHTWGLEVPLPAGTKIAPQSTCSTRAQDQAERNCQVKMVDDKLQWRAFHATRTLLPPNPDTQVPQRNTIAGIPNIQGPKSTFSVVLQTPVALANWGVDDPWLEVIDTMQIVRHSSRDASGFPFAMNLPSEWLIPQEGVDMGLGYPSFANFVTTSGAQSADWYLKPVTTKTIDWKAIHWAW